MEAKKYSLWHKIGRGIRTPLVSGVFVLVPLAITFVVMRWLFLWMADFLSPIMRMVFGSRIPEFYIPLVSVVVLIAFIYLIGLIAGHFIGRKLIEFGEAVLLHIPLVRNIYSGSKQVVQAVTLPQHKAFEAVVFVEFPRPGMKTIGLVTGTVLDKNGQPLYKVFIPMGPNPTSGFFEIVSPQDVTMTDMHVDEAFKIIMSAGIVAPKQCDMELNRL